MGFSGLQPRSPRCADRYGDMENDRLLARLLPQQLETRKTKPKAVRLPSAVLEAGDHNRPWTVRVLPWPIPSFRRPCQLPYPCAIPPAPGPMYTYPECSLLHTSQCPGTTDRHLSQPPEPEDNPPTRDTDHVPIACRQRTLGFVWGGTQHPESGWHGVLRKPDTDSRSGQNGHELCDSATSRIKPKGSRPRNTIMEPLLRPDRPMLHPGHSEQPSKYRMGRIRVVPITVRLTPR